MYLLANFAEEIPIVVQLARNVSNILLPNHVSLYRIWHQ